MGGPIIVGVDGSATAASAATAAARLANALDEELHVVCAFDKDRVTEVVGEGSDRWLLSTAAQAESTAQAVAERLRSDGLVVVATAAQGDPGEALVAEAERQGAGIIVVGNRRVQGLGRVLGSVARDVAQHAPCDVHIVKTV